MQVETIEARYEFSEEEKHSMAMQVTEKELKVLSLEEEKKANADAFKAQIEPLCDQIYYLSRCVQNGYEPRLYKCRVEKDSVRQVRLYRDIESEKIIKEMPFTPEDMQGTLPGVSVD